MDPCWDSAETQVQFPSGMCLHLRCHSSGKGSSQKSLFPFCYGPDVFLNRNSLLQSLSVPSLSSTSKTPEEVVLCAALCLFIMWRLFADSGLGQPHLTGLNQFPGLFGLGSCPPAAPQPCFVMAEKQVLHIHVYIWEKERSGKETTDCYQSWGWDSALKEIFLSLYILSSTSHSSSEILSWRWSHDSLADLSVLHVVSNPKKCSVSCLLSTCCSKRWRHRSPLEGVCGDNLWVMQGRPNAFWTFKRKVLTVLLLCTRHTEKSTFIHTDDGQCCSI